MYFYVFDQLRLIHRPMLLDACVGLFVEPFVELAGHLVLLPLVCVQNILGQVSVIRNSSYLVAMDIFINQFFPILYSSLFSSINCSCWSPSNALPKPDIHILRSYIIDCLPERMYCASTVYWTLLTICILLA